ncbi:DUF1840 domain-containing protein [Xenophilus sp. Marseille-Q4582]|uniref:DUF1840 domain-containing protein n=1 Tax=Xenophilus sp. Marseille-Q4582 TaxID=2866600 RepID=UPI001CE4804B|nr:DUF1840 domain-containing protein [Xenophilus sp. Marseille-Q4582]
MLYRFKSQASADVLMLEGHARPLLEIIGKSAGSSGIITVDQMPGAISALQAASQREAEQGRHNHDAHAAEDHDTQAEIQHVGLHQRAAPLIKMMRESMAENRDIVWGT